MITFGLNYDVKPEHREKFVEVTRSTIKLMASLKGHMKTLLYADTASSNSFMIYSEWETMEDFRNFMASKEFRSVQSMGAEMLTKRPSHKIYETKSMH